MLCIKSDYVYQRSCDRKRQMVSWAGIAVLVLHPSQRRYLHDCVFGCGQQSIDVTLNEYKIKMPSTLAQASCHFQGYERWK
jgi:hypothetical protein